MDFALHKYVRYWKTGHAFCVYCGFRLILSILNIYNNLSTVYMLFRKNILNSYWSGITTIIIIITKRHIYLHCSILEHYLSNPNISYRLSKKYCENNFYDNISLFRIDFCKNNKTNKGNILLHSLTIQRCIIYAILFGIYHCQL